MPINYLNSAFPDAHWGTQPPMTDPSTKTPSLKHKGRIWSNPRHHHRHTANTSMLCTHYSTSPNFNPDQEDHSQKLSFDIQNHHTEAEPEMELERHLMFEKPLTPSDVGKLNRLVIPKQHAETYFPLCGRDSGENGLLLSFEDKSGRCWRFRYSYWNSSQSYVLTKGWSRFVKEKRLDAGDFVLFERHRLDSHRLFIGWRRNATPLLQDRPAAAAAHGDGWTPVFYPAHPYPSPPHEPLLPYQPDCLLHAGLVLQKEATPSESPKRLRLFGVTLDCQPESEPPVLDGPSMSSQGLTHDQCYSHNYAGGILNHEICTSFVEVAFMLLILCEIISDDLVGLGSGSGSVSGPAWITMEES